MDIVIIKKTGDLIITKDTQYNNVSANNVLVKEGITTRIFGTINKKLTLEKDSTVYLHGKVPSELINHGGNLYVFGSSGNITIF